MGMHQAERGVALLRIFSGVWLLRAALAHLAWTPWPWASPAWVQAVADQLAGHALRHPSFWVRYLIQQVLLPHVGVTAGLSVDIELLAGLSLALGAFTLVGALLGLLIALCQGVLLHYLGDAYLGFALLQGLVMVIVFITRAGRRWGLDAVFSGLQSRSLLW